MGGRQDGETVQGQFLVGKAGVAAAMASVQDDDRRAAAFETILDRTFRRPSDTL
jgi:hypothetical protein